MSRRLFRATLTAIALPIAGCTSIHLHNQDSVTVTTKFGLTVIRLDQLPTAATVVKTDGLGVISTPTGVTIGWVSELFAAIPADSRCQIFLWIEKQSELESLLSLLRKNEKSLNNICIIDSGGVHEAR